MSNWLSSRVRLLHRAKARHLRRRQSRHGIRTRPRAFPELLYGEARKGRARLQRLRKKSGRAQEAKPRALKRGHIFNAHPSQALLLFPPSWPLKYLFLKDLAGNGRKNRPEIRANLLIYKHFTSKSLFLKDMAKHRR